MAYADPFGQRFCRTCGMPFTLSAAEHVHYRQPGRQLPVRCEDCRAVRRVKKDAAKARKPPRVRETIPAWRWSVYTSGFFGKGER